MRPVLARLAAVGLALLASSTRTRQPAATTLLPGPRRQAVLREPAPRRQRTAGTTGRYSRMRPSSRRPRRSRPHRQRRANGDHRVLYYRNPMGLPDTSPKPKNDSMGMDYIPSMPTRAARATRPAPSGSRRAACRLLGVRTEAAEMRPAAARSVRATGILQFDERRLVTVTTRVPGWVEHLTVAATGDPVKRGQVLAEIYAPDMVASEEEYLDRCPDGRRDRARPRSNACARWTSRSRRSRACAGPAGPFGASRSWRRPMAW